MYKTKSKEKSTHLRYLTDIRKTKSRVAVDDQRNHQEGRDESRRGKVKVHHYYDKGLGTVALTKGSGSFD